MEWTSAQRRIWRGGLETGRQPAVEIAANKASSTNGTVDTMIQRGTTSASTADYAPLGYYLENGCTVANNVKLVERIYGTRRLVFFECDREAILAELPTGWTIREDALANTNLILSFNDWTSHDLPDGSPHKIVSPRFVGFLVPVRNDEGLRSGFMQVYGLAADNAYLPGPYRAYRGASYFHSCITETDGLQSTWTHDQYKLRPSESTGEFLINISHRRTLPRRVKATRPNVAVFSPFDSNIERFYQEDVVLDMVFAPAMNIRNTKSLQLEWTIPAMASVMSTAKFVGMIYNSIYLRDVYER